MLIVLYRLLQGSLRIPVTPGHHPTGVQGIRGRGEPPATRISRSCAYLGGGTRRRPFEQTQPRMAGAYIHELRGHAGSDILARGLARG